MNFTDFLNAKTGKKWGVAVVAMIMLAQMSAPTWQIMAVAIAAILAQAWDDRKKLPEKTVQTPPPPTT